MKVKVALLQLNPEGSFKKNFLKTKNSLIKAKEKGADIAIFPELWNIGYEVYPNQNPHFDNWKNKSICIGDKTYKKYVNLSKETGIAMVFTFLESDKKRKKFYNTAILVDNKGKRILKYRKTHIVDRGWERIFVAGDKFPVRKININGNLIKIGLMICYDREFPEVARILMLNGAELILVPNACFLESNRIASFQSRGFENMVGVAMANYAGKKFRGKSVAFSGMREVGKDFYPLLADGKRDKESISVANFDIDKLRAYRKRDIWGDAYRRPILYKPLIVNNPKRPFKRTRARRNRSI